MTIKAIGFDYGGVIGGGDKVGKRFSSEVSQVVGITEDQYREIYFSINHLINTGRVETWREFWQIFLAKLGQEDKLESLVSLSKRYSHEYIVMDDVIISLIDRLRRAGYRVGLLSNATSENAVQMRAAGLDKHFDVFHISAETKNQKPLPITFELFAQELGVRLNELVFVDDAEKSLSTAKECGFTPILYRSSKKLVTELNKLGIPLDH